jgi:hypothetical protein
MMMPEHEEGQVHLAGTTEDERPGGQLLDRRSLRREAHCLLMFGVGVMAATNRPTFGLGVALELAGSSQIVD